MSADNWTSCPRCQKKTQAAYDELQARAAKSYGVLPLDEFDALRAEAAKPIEDNETLHEDYEIGIYNDKFYARYKGQCKTEGCGFVYEFQKDEEGLT